MAGKRAAGTADDTEIVDAVIVDDGDAELGEVAQQGAGEEFDGGQPALVEEGPVVKFLGVRFASTDPGLTYSLGQEVEFLVRGRVTEISDGLDANNRKRHTVKVKTGDIIPK